MVTRFVAGRRQDQKLLTPSSQQRVIRYSAPSAELGTFRNFGDFRSPKLATMVQARWQIDEGL